MTVSTEKIAAGARRTAEPRHPASELAVVLLFGPLADRMVRLLAPLRVPPPAVVLANTAAGLAAALLVYEGAFVLAAVLLQVKTLLDNVDGRLARASGRTDLLGRYLDTEADFVVNAALCLALGSATGEPWLALAAFVGLTLILSADFNAARAYRAARGLDVGEPLPTGRAFEHALARVYGAVFAPQDRLLRALSARRLVRVLDGEASPRRREAAERAYHDHATVAVLANLGLSTQLLVLGALLVAGAPSVYLWLVLGSLALLPALQLRRERLARRALAR